MYDEDVIGVRDSDTATVGKTCNIIKDHYRYGNYTKKLLQSHSFHYIPIAEAI